MVNKLIAVIPARGGSKRIKGKNIIDFNGVPMISKTIEAAQKTEIFDRIIVSTDDSSIAAVAEKYGVKVPFLRSDKSDDFSSVSEATIHAVYQAEEFWGEEYTYVIQLMANCPLRNESDIKCAWNNFIKNDIEFQISCFKYGWMNPWWAMKLKEDGTPEPLYQEALKKRSQDLEDLYCPTGAIWIARVDALKKAGTFYGPNYKMFPIGMRSSIDIDDMGDLQLARAMDKIDKF